jgi:serine acetyltransferase
MFIGQRWHPLTSGRGSSCFPTYIGGFHGAVAAGYGRRRRAQNVTDEPNTTSLVAQILEDWKSHGREWTRPGFQAVAVHRFGNWRMRIGPRALRVPFSVLYQALYTGVRNIYGIEIPYTARLGRRVIVEHHSGIVVHGHSTVGDDCILRQGVTLGNRSLDEPLAAPQLGKRVNIGAGAKILGGVLIGDDAQIGANAVVLIDVPPGALAVGVPARVVQTKKPRGVNAQEST